MYNQYIKAMLGECFCDTGKNALGNQVRHKMDTYWKFDFPSFIESIPVKDE